MNNAEAKRQAHGAVAGLIRVNIMEGSDLTAGFEEDHEAEADRDRFYDACEEIANSHAKRGPDGD